jgi:hypothetical protein
VRPISAKIREKTSRGSGTGGPTDLEPLERPTQLADLKAARRELADNPLAAARSELPFEYLEIAGELAAAFLRRYDARRATQGAYALDLADLTRLGYGIK